MISSASAAFEWATRNANTPPKSVRMSASVRRRLNARNVRETTRANDRCMSAAISVHRLATRNR
jgi:hypothetical protein